MKGQYPTQQLGGPAFPTVGECPSPAAAGGVSDLRCVTNEFYQTQTPYARFPPLTRNGVQSICVLAD